MKREADRLGNVLHLINDLQEQLQEKMDTDQEKMETLNDLESLLKERMKNLAEQEGCC